MMRIESGVKLKRGTIVRIAKRRKLSHEHVRLVVRGEREGSTGLVTAILREAVKQAEASGQPLQTATA